MLLHYPQQYEHHILPIHYQSFESSSTSFPLQASIPALATPISLPQRSLQSSQASMPASQQQPSNPAVRIHQSTPSPGDGAQSNNNQLMLAQGAFLGGGWGSERFSSVRYLDTLPRKTGKYHKRLSSASSINSAGPPSPHDHSSPYCQIVNSDSSQFSPLENVDCVSTPQQNHFPKLLPTPVGTPTFNHFMPPGYQNASSAQETHGYSASAMRRIHSATGDDDGSAFTFSGPQSVSSMTHTSPATPHTNYEPEFDEKSFGQGENILSIIDAWMDEYSPFFPGFPQSAAFSQAMQDVFADQSYNSPASPSFSQQSQPSVPHTSSHLSPYRNMSVFASRLQAANQKHLANRTGSPVTSVTRERSPFKAYNQMQELGSDISPQNPMTAMTQAMMEQPRVPTAPKSISPKELMLEDPDLDEADTTPLFQSQFDQSSNFANRRPNANMSNFPDQSGMFSRTSFSAVSTQVPQQYPFISERRRQQSDMQDGESEQVPDFPAHLLSMETTVEEGSSEPSSSQQASDQQSAQWMQRPDDTSSDCGTYTCTYRGCTLRFETPAKLQKHKREAHRQTSPNTTSSSSGPTSAAAAASGLTNLGLRNSQAGPHKCERTNPSTGKPCNSIFSRPYDLTRHEDTIHNARKQKVRCHLCTEEKTFSRNDALTRHMRVVHPDVDWPGKTRRGKGRD